MTFKIVLTVFFCMGALLNVLECGNTRQPRSYDTAWAIAFVYAVMIYGIWNWL